MNFKIRDRIHSHQYKQIEMSISKDTGPWFQIKHLVQIPITLSLARVWLSVENNVERV